MSGSRPPKPGGRSRHFCPDPDRTVIHKRRKRDSAPGRSCPILCAVTQPGGTRKAGRKVWIGAVAAAVLLTGACGKLGGEPASAADNAKVLADVDASLKEPFGAVTKGDKAA